MVGNFSDQTWLILGYTLIDNQIFTYYSLLRSEYYHVVSLAVLRLRAKFFGIA